MDCERFDQHVIDALYDELDEVTYAALRRHVEGCSRCASTWASLRATREVGILPIEEPPDDLEARILEAVAKSGHQVPWHKTLLRGLAWAGSHAMRPQLAMAAVFVLVIGSSLLLLRPHGAQAPTAVAVSERGRPDPSPPSMAAESGGYKNEGARGAAAAAAPASPPAGPMAAAKDQGNGYGSPREEGSIAAAAASAVGDGKSDTASDARSALAEARATRDRSGCVSAVSRFDGVAASFPGTQAAADAMWEESACYAQMGDRAHSDQLLIALRSTGYRDRANRELESRSSAIQSNAVAAAPAPAARAPAKPSPAASGSPAGGMNPRAPAAPRKAATDTPVGF